MKKQKIIIDADPGVDDAIALLYATGCNDFDIKLVSTIYGNNRVENVAQNALHILELLKKPIKVSKGLSHPLKREANFAVGVHGKQGLGNHTYNPKKILSHVTDKESPEEIYDILKSSDEKISIVSIGPMTNLAKLLTDHPDCKAKIQQIIFESGTKEKIFGKPYKSFNVGADPEAAEIVFRSGVKLVMVPMELGHFAYLDKEDIKRFKNTGKIGKIYAKMFAGYHDFHVGNLGAAVHDACAVYFLSHPENIKTESAFIEVKYYQDESENYGYVDIDFNKKPNADVCVDLDINSFKSDLFEVLEKFEKEEK